ncbi:MAG: extracellular solute-binding protein [bacterium]|nr:extracellular solute-binding protein [bacterium]
MSKFQTILLGIFVVFAVGGVIVFSSFKGGTENIPSLVIWGTLEKTPMDEFLNAILTANGLEIKLQYVQKRPESLYQDYLEAIAARRGPDILLMSQDQILKFRGKLGTIPYGAYPQKDFKDTFIQQAELYLDPAGITAFPFSVDPLVMYWNRDMFTNAGISSPPKQWNEFLSLSSKLTDRDAATNITKSAVALGEAKNISHAKEILSLLMFQTGNSVTAIGNVGVESVLTNNPTNQQLPPTAGALRFYTEFANPVKEVYSWNKSLPNSTVYFTSNRLGIYFGFASEAELIRQRNPNLNWGVTTVPQADPRLGLVNSTYGRMYGMSLSATSPNIQYASSIVSLLTSKDALTLWSQLSKLPSVRRDSLGIVANDSAGYVFSISALWSKGWLDPDYIRTRTIFNDMIENVTNGRMPVENALSDAHNKIQNILGK